MSQVYLVRTNQKVNFARIQLDMLEDAHQENGWDKHAKIESLHESTLFLMASALDAYYKEIAEKYRFNPSKVTTFSDLEKMVDDSVQESPEVQEIKQLMMLENSWLNKLMLAYASCWKAVDGEVVAPKLSSVSEIHVVQINPDHQQDGNLLVELRGWLNDIRRLLEAQRSSLQEW
jgi:hypothetical protein